mgnify:CR=1 FL=1
MNFTIHFKFNFEFKLKNISNLIGVNQIRTCAYNPKANGLIERYHRSLKSSLKCRGGNWYQQLPIVLLGLRMQPDESGDSAFSRVMGEQPIVPAVISNSFNLSELSTRLHQIVHHYKPPEKRNRQEYLPESLKKCEFVWVRLDRVKKPLEAPYQGPYKVVSRHPNFYVLKIRGKEDSVSIERLKPAILSKSFEETIPPKETSDPVIEEKNTEPGTSTKGRKVKFKQDNDYVYF